MRGEGRKGKMEERFTREINEPKLLDILSTQNVTIALHIRQIVLLVILVRQIVCGNISSPPATNLQRPIRSVFFADTTLALLSARKLLFQRFCAKFSVATKCAGFVISAFSSVSTKIGMLFSSIEIWTIFFLII